MVNAMKKAYTPNPKFKGDSAALHRLDKAIESAITRDPRLALEYESENLNLQIAALLHMLRTERGLTQEQFAKQAGFNQPFVARLENPSSEKQPSLETLAKIASAFNKRLIIEFADI
jgi:DNA-binding XRE family transcriptional regulator